MSTPVYLSASLPAFPGRRYSDEEIGAVLGVTKQRVQQIVERALWKLRRNARARMLLSKHEPERAGALSYEDIYGEPGEP